MATYGDNNPHDTIPISSLKPNSNKYHESNKKPDKNVEKVASGRTRKKSVGKMFADTFLADDIRTVKGYIFKDVVVPTIKNLIVDMISDTAERLFFGETRGRRSSGGGLNERNSYTAYYKSGNRNRSGSDSRDRNARIDYSDIIFDTRDEAEEVLTNLIDLTTEYSSASVGDLYDLAGISREANFTDEKWGWVDFSGANVRRVRDGYLLDLPKAKPLD